MQRRKPYKTCHEKRQNPTARRRHADPWRISGPTVHWTGTRETRRRPQTTGNQSGTQPPTTRSKVAQAESRHRYEIAHDVLLGAHDARLTLQRIVVRI